MAGLLDLLGLGGALGSNPTDVQAARDAAQARLGLGGGTDTLAAEAEAARIAAALRLARRSGAAPVALAESEFGRPDEMFRSGLQGPALPAPSPAVAPDTPPASGTAAAGNGLIPGVTPNLVKTVPQPGMTPGGAAPTAGSFAPPAPPPAPPAAPALPGRLAPAPVAAAPGGGLMNFLGDNSRFLMGLGAGLVGGRSIGEGFSKGFAGAAAGAESDKERRSENQTAKVFEEKLGLSREEAVAAAQNPAMTRHLIERLYALPKLHDVERPLGGKDTFVFDPRTGTLRKAEVAAAPGTVRQYGGKYWHMMPDGRWAASE